jgi:hypothetical protein
MSPETMQLFADAKNHWHDLARRHAQGVPHADDFRPEAMARWMPDATLVEFDMRGFDFRFRLVGTRIAAFYGEDFTNCELTRLSFALDRDNTDTFWHWWHRIEWPVPGVTHSDHVLAPGRTVMIDRLLLPYRGRTPHTAMLLAIQAPVRDCGGDWRHWQCSARERVRERRRRARAPLTNPWAA